LPGLNKTLKYFVASPLFLSFIIVILASCSTKKNTFTRRTYHNLTAHYNAYFNGNEALKEGVSELQKKAPDNYVNVLPVFNYGTKQDAQAIYALMDRAIEKASIVIQRHSIFIKRVEHVKWIDRSYLMIANAYLYKQDYDLAIQTCDFIAGRYKKSMTVYGANLTKARALIQTGKYTDAENILTSLSGKIEKNKATKLVEKEYPLVLADLYVKQGSYSQAIEFLQASLKFNKKKYYKTRLNFILAQVFQRTGDLQRATESYRKVLSYNPPYEMAFSAKINMAKCYDVASGDSKLIKSQLNKMLKDEKNKEYKDQIYYALAEVYLKENNEDEAIKNLLLSARTSVKNDYQKGISYLKLGEMFYTSTNYKSAQIYYDSAVVFLPKDFPNISSITSRKNTLNDLVKNITVVELEDSLQRLAQLPEGERLKKIDAIIAQIIADEQKRRQEEADRQQALNNLQQNNTNFSTSNSQWYFYNSQSIAMGFSEFTKKWGNRKLEDLWRLTNKQVISFDFDNKDQNPDSVGVDSNAVASFNPKDRNSYLKQIPVTPEMINKSNERIKEALFNMGIIFKNGIGDLDKAIEAFEKLSNRFPDNQYLGASYYYLYKIYEEKENVSKADYYKNLLITKFPNSDYSRILTDPNYYKTLDSLKNLVAGYYKTTYLAYTSADYNTVIRNCDSALIKYNSKEYNPKFEYLKALAIAKTQGVEMYKKALQAIIQKYPSSEVKTLAQNTLNTLNDMSGNGSGTPDSTGNNPKDANLYKFNPGDFHFYIMVVDARNININEMKIAFSDHNLKMYSLDKLIVNTLFLDEKREVINVARFDNKDKAMDYYLSVTNNTTLTSKIKNGDYQHFVISANNYSTFYKSKDVEKYLVFFNKNYK
jgi:tetratricopeptide (TPR) repeat protein